MGHTTLLLRRLFVMIPFKVHGGRGKDCSCMFLYHKTVTKQIQPLQQEVGSVVEKQADWMWTLPPVQT